MQQMFALQTAFDRLKVNFTIQKKSNQELQHQLPSAEIRIQNAEQKVAQTTEHSADMENELAQWNQ